MMIVVLRKVDEWVQVGSDVLLSPTDIDARTVRVIVKGRMIGGPDDGQPFEAAHEMSRGQSISIGPLVHMAVMEIRPPVVQLGLRRAAAPPRPQEGTRRRPAEEEGQGRMSSTSTTMDAAAPALAAPNLPAKLSLFAADIKVSHTVFAMPWAILSAVMAWDIVRGPLIGSWRWS
jgi:sRNA-binding carbon storage regulator CsrA